MTTTQLTPAQHAILAKAINTSAGKIEWFPDNIKGGARKKVLDGLFNRVGQDRVLGRGQLGGGHVLLLRCSGR